MFLNCIKYIKIYFRKNKKEKRLLLTCSTLSPPVDEYINCVATLWSRVSWCEMLDHLCSQSRVVRHTKIDRGRYFMNKWNKLISLYIDIILHDNILFDKYYDDNTKLEDNVENTKGLYTIQSWITAVTNIDPPK